MKATLAIWGLLLAGLISGCSQPETAQQEQKKEIVIWWAQWDPAAGLQELGNLFEQQTGIAVKVHQIPWASYQEKVFLNYGNKQTDFDIVIGDSQWLGRGATKGLYLDLSEWLPQKVDIATIHPKALRYLSEYPPGSGKYFAAPCETDAIGFVYRRDWFEDPAEMAAFESAFGRPLAVPETWEEFRDLAQFFNRPEQKRYGCALLTGRGYDSAVMGFQPFLWAWGGSWGDEQTFAVDGHVNSAGAVAGLGFLKELLQFAPPGGTKFDYAATLDAFENGSTAMTLDYFPFYPGIVEKMGDQVGFFMVPGKDGKRAISLGGQGMSISTKTTPQRQELAKEFIAWFLQTEIQEKWVTYPGCFTANTALLASEEFKAASPYNETFARSLDHVQDFWNVPQYNELLAAAQKRLGEALDDVSPPQEALDKLAAEHEAIFRQAGLLQTK